MPASLAAPTLETWKTPDGESIDPAHTTAGKGTVCIFVTTDCPLANRYAPEIQRIVREYGSRGFAFFLVYEDEQAGPEAVQRHVREYGLSGRALLDPAHTLARRLGATVTSQAVVVGVNRKLRYSGRIDDRVVTYGTVRSHVGKRDLRLALDAILAGRPISGPQPKPIGCLIPPAVAPRGA